VSVVADNLKQRRKHLGLTQEELAERLHVTRQAVSNWEHDKTQPDLEMLAKLAEELDTDLPALLGQGEEKAPPASGKRELWVLVGLVCGGLFLMGIVLKAQVYERMRLEYGGEGRYLLLTLLNFGIHYPLAGAGVAALLPVSLAGNQRRLLTAGVLCLIPLALTCVLTAAVYVGFPGGAAVWLWRRLSSDVWFHVVQCLSLLSGLLLVFALKR